VLGIVALGGTIYAAMTGGCKDQSRDFRDGLHFISNLSYTHIINATLKRRNDYLFVTALHE
jgi:hypothetical protein